MQRKLIPKIENYNHERAEIVFRQLWKGFRKENVNIGVESREAIAKVS